MIHTAKIGLLRWMCGWSKLIEGLVGTVTFGYFLPSQISLYMAKRLARVRYKREEVFDECYRT